MIALFWPARSLCMRTKRRFRKRRNKVHLVRGSPLAQRLLHLLILQVQHGQNSLQQKQSTPPDCHQNIINWTFLNFVSIFFARLSALTNSGGEGIHHRRGGHHLPGVRQEEADGGHRGAVARLQPHPSCSLQQQQLIDCSIMLENFHTQTSHCLRMQNPFVQYLVSFLFSRDTKFQNQLLDPTLKSLQACQLN